MYGRGFGTAIVSLAIATGTVGAEDLDRGTTLGVNYIDSVGNGVKVGADLPPELIAILENNRREQLLQSRIAVGRDIFLILSAGGIAYYLSRKPYKIRNVRESQRNGWDSLNLDAQETIMELWPNGVHGSIKQGGVGDCYLQVVIAGIKYLDDVHVLLSQIIRKKKGGYVVTIDNIEYVIANEEKEQLLADTKEIGYQGQLGDRLITRAYWRYRNRDTPEIGTMLPRWNKDRIFEGGYSGEVIRHLFGIKTAYYTPMNKLLFLNEWVNGQSIAFFSFHPSGTNDTIIAGIPYDSHVYCIVDINKQSGQATIINPHDSSREVSLPVEMIFNIEGLSMSYCNSKRK